LRFVFDTNVYISGGLSAPAATPAPCVALSLRSC